MQKEDEKQARDCFLISGVIYPDVKKQEIYRYMEQWVMQKDKSNLVKLEEYFL